MPSGLPDVRAMSLSELEALVTELGQPAYRAKQIFRWLHLRGARRWSEMTDLSQVLRQELEKAADIGNLEFARVERARDGTRKYAFRTARGDVIESVFIPDASADGRNTLCISSQVGCAIDCKFCLTASLGLLRNLTAGEIVEQVTRVKEDLAKDAAEARADIGEAGLGDGGPVDPEPINNIVMMGMGEPLQNYGAVVESLKILTSPDGHNIGTRRITVSTSGLAPRIPRLGHDVKVNLAVSLNATTDEVRDRIMPINKRWNIAELLKACREFPLPERRRITFEYVLLAGVNDTDDDARRLVKLLRGIRCKVNLIPFNEHPYSPFQRPSEATVARFQRIVADGGLSVFVRTARGDDISAACGQLGAEVDAPRKKLVVLQ
ncbi:23S rRNA (adenine(2503)-C(2))-methyltransferase RlmN [Myxococcota bacterium]|nr:23S rRNA (adenine(2503)-C(2))-methyltransferase RlmN [Myxococcota bacterium]